MFYVTEFCKCPIRTCSPLWRPPKGARRRKELKIDCYYILLIRFSRWPLGEDWFIDDLPEGMLKVVPFRSRAGGGVWCWFRSVCVVWHTLCILVAAQFLVVTERRYFGTVTPVDASHCVSCLPPARSSNSLSLSLADTSFYPFLSNCFFAFWYSSSQMR